MSIYEEAEQLRAIASSDRLPIGLIREAQSKTVETQNAVLHVLGSMEGDHAQTIANMAAAANEHLESALAALQGLESAIHDAADYHARG